MGSIRFDRRKLKKVKDVPRDQLESLVDKVELASNFDAESRLNRKLVKMFVFAIIIIVSLSVLASLHKGDESSSQSLSQEQLDLQETQSLFQNSSLALINKLISQKDAVIKNRSRTKEDTVEDDEKTAQYIARFFESIDRKTSLPKLLLALIFSIISGPLIYLAKLRQDDRKAFKSISTLLNIENDLYFCRKGYLWSIDHNVSRLKLTKTHSSKTFEQAPEEPRFPNSEICDNAIYYQHPMFPFMMQAYQPIPLRVNEEKQREMLTKLPILSKKVSAETKGKSSESKKLEELESKKNKIPSPPQIHGLPIGMMFYPYPHQPGVSVGSYPYYPQLQTGYHPPSMGYYGQYPPQYMYQYMNQHQQPVASAQLSQEKKVPTETFSDCEDSEVPGESAIPAPIKPRSYTKKRKLNPDSGSAHAKLTTTAFPSARDQFR